jgi:tRNA pseudouridine38-40 synthase
MHNYKLIIQYDGTNYAGWQTQLNAPSVQQKIIESAGLLLKEEVNLVGAGRTDSGVHALGQAANFRTDKLLDISKFSYQLNSILPRDISVLSVEQAAENFHARFDAKKRSYIYIFSKHKSPFFDRYSYRHKGFLNAAELNSLSKAFLGVHNFTTFSKKNSDTRNKICNIYDIRWRETNGLLLFYIEADRYLHGMVRTIVGTLLHMFNNKIPAEHILSLFDKEDREAAGASAPGKGLFLYKVKY